MVELNYFGQGRDGKRKQKADKHDLVPDILEKKMSLQRESELKLLKLN